MIKSAAAEGVAEQLGSAVKVAPAAVSVPSTVRFPAFVNHMRCDVVELVNIFVHRNASRVLVWRDSALFT